MNMRTNTTAAEEVLGLGESGRVGDDEGIIIDRTEIGPRQYLVQFEADNNQWLAANKVPLDA